MSRKHRHRVKRRKDRGSAVKLAPIQRTVQAALDQYNAKWDALDKWIKDRGGRRVYPGEEADASD